jgi:Fe-S-cluster containining protein
MSETPAQSLCTQCGLCCTGAIFADVELRDEKEATAMECLGLEIEEEDGRALLIQPCRALRGKRCGVYAHRPDCCRRFECKVLKDFESGKISVTKALGTIDRLRGLIKTQDHHAVRKFVNRQFLDFQ